jgi:hypothetical protein
LAGGVPEGELDGAAVDAAVGDVVLEDGRDVVGGEVAEGEDGEEGGFAAGPVADYY